MSSKRNIEAIYPLSPMQQGMLFHSLYAPESGVYFEQFRCTLKGQLNRADFHRAWQQVINRHAALRTAFVWKQIDKTVQVVQRDVPVQIAEFDWRHLTAVDQSAQLEAYLHKERQTGFDLAQAPLMRFALAQTAVDEHIFIWNFHHLLLDGWSLPLVLREVMAYYEAFSQGQNLQLETPPAYRSYINWLQQQDETVAAQYWQKRLQGFTAPTPLVVDRPASGKATAYEEQQICLTETTTTALQTLARQHQLTMSTLVQAAWALLLHRYSGEDDVVFGATVSGRPPALPHVDKMVGLFINTLPVRATIDETMPLLHWLQQFQAQLVDMRQYEHNGLSQIQGWSNVPRGQSLFESILVFENYPVDAALLNFVGSLQIKDITSVEQTNYPLNVISGPGGALPLRISYDVHRFSQNTISRMLAHLRLLLEGMAAEPYQPIASLPMLTAAEQAQLLAWNQTSSPYPANHCIHELFQQQVEKTPQATAVVFQEESLTYTELNRRANQLAHQLRQQGVGPNSIVGICLHRSPDMIISLLAVLKAGGAFLPLDPTYPAERLTFMLEDAKPTVLLTEEQMVASGKLQVAGENLPLTILDVAWPTISQAPDTNLETIITPDNLVYLIYTSGSTGVPKGALLPHRGVCNLVAAQEKLFNPGALRRVLQFASFSFDAAVWEIFMALGSGGELHLAAQETVMSPDELHRLLQASRITAVTLPPTMLSVLSPDDLPDLELIISAGERLSAELVRKWAPGYTLFNGYGPTEATVGTTMYCCESNGTEAPPIGRPLPNTQLYVLDRRQRLVPVGVPGELYIGGVGVGCGYLNRPELTAERFVPLPVNSSPMAEHQLPTTVYRTGDLVRWRADGNLEFLGRLDHQVKVRGFRIELGEIEAVLQEHAGVQETAVALHLPEHGDSQIVAYVVPAGNNGLTTPALQAYLKERLPVYMVPAAFVMLESLPLLPNGKVNRRALPSLDGAQLDLNQQYVPPRTPVEEIIAGVWTQILGVKRVGIHDDFHALGGHSLLATQIISRLRRVFRTDLPLRTLFENPTVAELATAVQSTTRPENDYAEPPLQPVPRDEDLPLSFAQQRLWFLEQLEPGNLFYNIPIAVRLTGVLDVAALRQSLNEMVRRHEVLRTTFFSVKGRPQPCIVAILDLLAPVEDLRHLPASAREATAQHHITQEAQRPFDLQKGPLLRVRLLRLADDEHIVILVMHHIVSDGWSMGILVQEMAALYEAFAAGRPSPLPELPLQYADFAHWQRDWLQGDVLDQQLTYWKEQLGSSPPLLDLPTDRPRPAVQSWHGAVESFKLSPELSQKLQELSREQGTTLFMTLLAAFQILLYRYSGQQDISVGTAVANRTRTEAENLIGFFVNTLVMRTDLSGQPNFVDLLRRVREVALGAYAHQDLPFEMLVEALQPQRDLSHTPLFQVVFSLQNTPAQPVAPHGLTWTPLPAESGTAKFDLTLEMAEKADGLQGFLEYNTDLFNRETIERLVGHFQTLLAGIVAQPDQPLSQLPLLTAAEQQQILATWNNTAVPFPTEQTIHRRFEQHAATQPESIALRFEGQTMTYGELNSRANQLAHHLQKQGVGPDSLVGILTDRSLEMVVGILGVLKAGGAYLPLDPTYPAERLTFMIQDAQPVVLLTQAHLVAGGKVQVASDLSQTTTGQPQPDKAQHTLKLDSDWPTISQEARHNPTSPVTADHLAYVIYTSGSTGLPKGALLAHRGLVNLSQAQRHAFNIRAGESRILQFSPLSFDASVWETFMALANGATLVLARQEILASGHDLLRLLQAERVSNITLPPSVLAVLPQEELPHLETIIAAGEACPVELVQRWAGGRAFFNAYGPTETTVCASMYRCQAHETSPPPIGRPIANCRLYILDAQQQPVPIGVPGELCIGGVNLARGYHNRPELTRERFVPLPLNSEPLTDHRLPTTVYRTGDLCRWRADGHVEFLGRIDHQVKVRGFRIELGEIETALRKHDKLQEAVVLVREDVPGDRRLVAYVVPQAEADLSDNELRGFLRQTLPEYMLPSQIIWLDAIPLSPSGKVDRQALPKPEQERPSLSERYVAPRNEVETQLAAICAELLQLERVGVYDNFFELGGHSLLATQFISRIHDLFHVELPVRALFESPTVAGLAECVAAVDTAGDPELAKIERLLADVEQLSEEEVLARLSEKKALVHER